MSIKSSKLKQGIEMKNFNAIRMLLNMPVEYIVEDDSYTMSGHFAGYDDEGYAYVFSGGKSLLTTNVEDELVKCRFIKAMDVKSQGVFNTNKAELSLQSIGFNIKKVDGIYVGHYSIDDVNKVKNSKTPDSLKKTMLGYNPITVNINDPVMCSVDKSYLESQVAHFAGYDEEGNPFVYELGGTSYTRSFNQQYIKVNTVSNLNDKNTVFKMYKKLIETFTSRDSVIVNKDTKTLYIDSIEDELTQTTYNKNLFGLHVNNTNLSRGSFINVNLSGATLNNVNLSKVNIKNADISEMNMDMTIEDIIKNLTINGLSISKLELNHI